MKKSFSLMLVLVGLTVGFMVGCDGGLTNFILNNAELCSVINCEQLGLVDVTGPANPLIPDNPDYESDPTCTLPGMCGPSPWYPYSIAEDAGEPVTTGS